MTEGDAQHAETDTSRRRVPRALIVVAIAVFVIVVDQLTKIWALDSFELGQRHTVIPGVLDWVLAKNSGAAFSLLSGSTWIFTVLSTLVVIVIIVGLRRVRATIWAVVVGMVLGGATGNLIDRLFREPGFGIGHVVDFIYTPWIVPAIYNVADMGVVIGMLLFLLLTILGVQADGKRPIKVKPADE